MKTFKRIVLVLLLLLIAGGLVLSYYADSIVRSTVEQQSTKSLNLKTTLDAAKLSLFAGNLTLDKFKIASPPGFAAPNMLELDQGQVGVTYSDIRKSPVHVKTITLNGPHIVLEQAGGKLNVNAAMKQMPGSESSGSTSSDGSSTRLIIDEMQINNPVVTINPGLPGLTKSMELKLSSITLKQIGNADGAQNGAAIKEVVMQVLTAVVAKAQESDLLSGELKQLLKFNVSDLTAQLGPKFQQQLLSIAPKLGDITKVLEDKLPANLTDRLPKGLDVKNLEEKLPKNLGDSLGGLMGNKKKDKDKVRGQDDITTRP